MPRVNQLSSHAWHGHGPSRRGRLRSPVCAKRAAPEPKRSTQFQVVCFIDKLRDINNEKGKGNPAELTGSRRARQRDWRFRDEQVGATA
jgi:hypothetical protein